MYACTLLTSSLHGTFFRSFTCSFLIALSRSLLCLFVQSLVCSFHVLNYIGHRDVFLTAISLFSSVRFYSKFHKRRMEELNSTGLHQFISLFLTLSCVVDLEDVVGLVTTSNPCCLLVGSTRSISPPSFTCPFFFSRLFLLRFSLYWRRGRGVCLYGLC